MWWELSDSLCLEVFECVSLHNYIVFICLSTLLCRQGECGGLGGVSLLRLWPGLVFMLPWQDNAAPSAALHQAFSRRRLYFTHPQEPEERISQEESGPGTSKLCLQPRAPQTQQRRRWCFPKRQWRWIQARWTGERHQPAIGGWKRLQWKKWRSHVGGVGF